MAILRWRGLIAEQGWGDQCVAAFCRKRGLGVTHSFAWRKRPNQSGAWQFVEVQVLPVLDGAKAAAGVKREAGWRDGGVVPRQSPK